MRRTGWRQRRHLAFCSSFAFHLSLSPSFFRSCSCCLGNLTQEIDCDRARARLTDVVFAYHQNRLIILHQKDEVGYNSLSISSHFGIDSALRVHSIFGANFLVEISIRSTKLNDKTGMHQSKTSYSLLQGVDLLLRQRVPSGGRDTATTHPSTKLTSTDPTLVGVRQKSSSREEPHRC